MRARRCWGFFALVLLSPLATADDEASGRDLAATCAACHGTEGRVAPDSGIAALAGMPPRLFLQKWTLFKEGGPASIMHQIVKGYTDEEAEKIAAYFSARSR